MLHYPIDSYKKYHSTQTLRTATLVRDIFFTVAINSENYGRMFQNYPIISLCFKGLVPNGVIKSSGLSFLQDQFRNLLKKSLAGTHRNSRKSFHASFVRTCSSGSERAANDVIHLTDGCDAAGAKRLHLAAITTSRPTPRRIPRTFYFL